MCVTDHHDMTLADKVALNPKYNQPIYFSSTFILSSANAFNLDQSEILSFGKEIKILVALEDFLAHLSTTCSRGAFRVVRCLSCVVNNFFKHLLLPNRWDNLDQTWQECSLGGPLQKLFTEFGSIKNSGCHGNEIEFFK